MSFSIKNRNNKENNELNLLRRAQKEKWAVGQFNISNLETLRAILQAAQRLRSPVIIGTSESESSFLGLKQAVALIKSFKEEIDCPIFLNYDHGRDIIRLKHAIDLGYDSVHYDGSNLSLEDNISNLKELVAYGHKSDVLVEGELGSVGGSSEIHKEEIEIMIGNQVRPEDIDGFINETGVDILALGIGNIHGVYEDRPKPKIDVARLTEIKEKARIPFVFHGGSGVPEEEIRQVIECGFSKININTELRIAYAESLRNYLLSNRQEVKPYKIFQTVIENIQKVAEEKILLFKSDNKI